MKLEERPFRSSRQISWKGDKNANKTHHNERSVAIKSRREAGVYTGAGHVSGRRVDDNPAYEQVGTFNHPCSSIRLEVEGAAGSDTSKGHVSHVLSTLGSVIRTNIPHLNLQLHVRLRAPVASSNLSIHILAASKSSPHRSPLSHLSPLFSSPSVTVSAMWTLSSRLALSSLFPTIAHSLALNLPQNAADSPLALTQPSSLLQPFNTSFILPHQISSHLSTFGKINCDERRFGHPPAPSCRDAITQLPQGAPVFTHDPTLSYGPRDQGGPWDVPLPKRYISRESSASFYFRWAKGLGK